MKTEEPNKEIWKNINGFEGFYQISNLGRIKSLYRIIPHKLKGSKTIPEKILKNNLDSTGYYIVALSKNCKSMFVRIHRLLALYFIPNPKNKPQVNHIDGNKLNNNLENLEWVTAKENMIHAHKIGIAPPPPIHRGEDNHLSIFTIDEVLKIRRLYATGNFKQCELADNFNTYPSTIRNILIRNTWKHI